MSVIVLLLIVVFLLLLILLFQYQSDCRFLYFVFIVLCKSKYTEYRPHNVNI